MNPYEFENFAKDSSYYVGGDKEIYFIYGGGKFTPEDLIITASG